MNFFPCLFYQEFLSYFLSLWASEQPAASYGKILILPLIQAF